MARSDEAEWWFNAVYEAVQDIPHGQVTSYGHIARLLGRREFSHVHFTMHHRLSDLIDKCYSGMSSVFECAYRPEIGSLMRRHRQVGICLKHLPSQSADVSHHFHNGNVPWQRVINAKGIISPRFGLRHGRPVVGTDLPVGGRVVLSDKPPHYARKVSRLAQDIWEN